MTEFAYGRQRYMGFALWAYALPDQGRSLRPETIAAEWCVDRATAYRWLRDFLTVTTGKTLARFNPNPRREAA